MRRRDSVITALAAMATAWTVAGPADAATLSCGVHLQGQPVMVNGSTRTAVTDNGQPTCSVNDAAAGIFRVGASQPVDVPYSASASATADLRTGQIKLVADTRSAHVYSSANVRMTERITIVAPGASVANPAPIRFLFDVEGDVEPGRMVNNSWQEWPGLAAVSAAITPSYGRDFLFGAQYYGDGTVLTSTYGDWRYGNGDPVLNTNGQYVPDYIGLPATFELTFWQQFETVSFDLLLHAQVTNNANFGHTIGARLVLPSAASFTSVSGLFLTQSPSGVPEPATWAMMIAGFGFAGTAMRRQARRAAALA